MLSVAVTVKLNVPLVVGVPVNAPPLASVKPPGKLPVVTLNVYGAVPPDAVRGWPYSVPAKPFIKAAGFTVRVGQLMMFRVYARVPLQLLASVAITVKLNVPATVVVPDKTPPVESVTPVGSTPEVMAKVYDDVLPVADSIWL